MIDSKDISVVVQGPIQKETSACLAAIRLYLPFSQIVLSTYKGSDVSSLIFDDLVLCDDPGAINASNAEPRINNVNRQTMTTKEGIKKCSRKYILKLRTDILLQGDKFLKYFSKMGKIKNNKYKVFDKKVIVLTTFTRKFMWNDENKKEYQTPFHVSDWVHFGLAQDIRKIWSDLEFTPEPEFSTYFKDKPFRKDYSFPSRLWRFPAEQYIFYSLFNKENPKVYMEHMLDYNKETVKFSDKYIETNFIILRPQDFSIDLKKYNPAGIQLDDEYNRKSFYKYDSFIFDKIKKFIFQKRKDGIKRTIKIFGIKFSYKKRRKLTVPPREIRTVEIEIFSYCNRKCWFCPNSFIDRHSKNILMDEDLYLKILKNLKEAGFRGKISYSRYNEPLSHLDIFLKRLNQAHKLLPDICLHTNTNGDFLTKDALEKVYSEGLKSMNIQCYLKKDEEFNNENIKQRIIKKAQELDLKYEFIQEDENIIKAKFNYKDMDLFMYARNFKLTGNTRGGSLDTIQPIKRIHPCFIPFMDIYIDYNGLVMPCCNLRSDIKAHKNFILGDTNKNSIIKIFNGRKIKKLRKILRKENIKLYPCSECNF